LKNVTNSWYGEIILKILKEKPIKSIRIKAHLNISIMNPCGTKNLRKKKFISKGLLKKSPILEFQKFINTIWLRFHKKRFHI
jgi:hypothetical protein